MPRHPSLYQLNTRLWVGELSRHSPRRLTLAEIPDQELDCLAALGFDWLWLLSVWQTGEVGKRLAQTHPELRKELLDTLPDLTDDDIPGSGFAITEYAVDKDFGGNAALARLRERLHQRGLRLMLDFVPNHTALDHVWVEQHPEYYIHGTEADLARSPKTHTQLKASAREFLLAHGRDPYFPAWTDTLQLNHANAATQAALIAQLQTIATQCDGVRCDMAMLLLPEVFERTWGIRSEPFWPKAIEQVRKARPEFLFVAEAYWDLERTLLEQGFDYAYDKCLYDRLREKRAAPIRDHLRSRVPFQHKLVHFLENHDEPRATAIFPRGMHEAAAIITFLAPGLRFFHYGQLEGRLKRVSVHLRRGPDEPVKRPFERFYLRLLDLLKQPILRDGEWQLLECRAAWAGNDSSDDFIASAWQHADARWLMAVNYSDHPSQCYVKIPFSDPGNGQCHLKDLLTPAQYIRDAAQLQSQGLYLDVPPWHCHVFELGYHPV